MKLEEDMNLALEILSLYVSNGTYDHVYNISYEMLPGLCKYREHACNDCLISCGMVTIHHF